jgi:hypothetical protein
MVLSHIDYYNHYWIVGDGPPASRWSSAAADYVSVGDATYQAWVAAGNTPTSIATEAELWVAILQFDPSILTFEDGAQEALVAHYTQTSYVGSSGASGFTFRNETIDAADPVVTIDHPLNTTSVHALKLSNSNTEGGTPGAFMTFFGGPAEDGRIEGIGDQVKIYTGATPTLRATFGTTITLAVGLSVAGGYTQSATGANTFISNVTVSPANANGTLGVTVSSNAYVPKYSWTQSGAIAWDAYLTSTAGDWMLDVQGGQNAIKVARSGTNVANVCLPNGQVAIGTTSPATSAKLDVSSTTGALLPPRMTSTQRDALTAAAGMVIYNTTTSKLQVYTSSWVDLH